MNEQELDEMVRDFTTVFPRAKSEVRRRILELVTAREAAAEKRGRIKLLAEFAALMAEKPFTSVDNVYKYLNSLQGEK